MASPLSASTPVNIKQLETELRQYPDRDFVEYSCDGLCYGFDTMINFIDMPTTESPCVKQTFLMPLN
jgi:hypothetical protein